MASASARCPRASAFVLAVTAALLAWPWMEAGAADVETITVDPRAERGVINRDLVGFGWHGHVPLGRIAPLEPGLVRIDASLERISPGPGVLRLGPLRKQVAAVRKVGGEPLVILSYTPAWLGRPRAFGRDPTRVAPADLDAWQRLIYAVVTDLATARRPALRFEAWNEPDLPLFWQDTQDAWLETVTRSARAVAAVERETGLDLAFGGPATVVPDPLWLEPFLARFRDPALPLDFVSWHYYGNYPFLGPDGAEYPGTEALLLVLGQENPLATPTFYRTQTGFMRELVKRGLAGSRGALPPLLLDEWNLSAGGFDRRHDTHVGAAFAAATLIEMQAARLDAAAFFRVDDARPSGSGDHGVLFSDGRRKPVWWTFELWQRLYRTAVAVAADPATGLFATASGARHHARRVTVLIASFSALAPAARSLELRVAGRRVRRATVRRIDTTHRRAKPHPARVADGVVAVALPAQAVALLELRLVRRASH